MPEISGVSHVSLSVRDRDASVKWYGELFGFQPFAEMNDEDGYVRTLMLHPTGVCLAFQQHTANDGGSFGPARTGLDHYSFAVSSPEELTGWAARFDEAGVEYTPVVRTPFGHVLCFRDPDGIQLELFYSPYA